MDVGLVVGLATAASVVTGVVVRLYTARSERWQMDAGAEASEATTASQLAEAARSLIAPLNAEIERMKIDLRACVDDRQRLSDQVSNLTGQVEVLRSSQAHLAAGTSESLLASMLAAAPDAILLVNEFGIVEFANRTAERMFGYADGAMQGLAVGELVPERFRERHRAHREHYMENPKARAMGADLDLWGRRFDGSEFRVEIGLSPMRRVGEEEKVVAVVRDMTERAGDPSTSH